MNEETTKLPETEKPVGGGRPPGDPETGGSGTGSNDDTKS